MNEISAQSRPAEATTQSSVPVTDPLELLDSIAPNRRLRPFPEHVYTTPRPRASNRLYRNNRAGTFTDVTKRAGLNRAGWASSVAVGDYDNDGHEDLSSRTGAGTFFTATLARAAWNTVAAAVH